MIARRFAIAIGFAVCATRAGAELPFCNAPGLMMPAAANSHLSDYPVLSCELHEEGTAIVSFAIGTDGRTGEATVLESSGSLRLDDASRESVRNWHYKPALSGGVPTACVQRAQVKWLIPEAAEPPKKAQ